MRNAPDRFGCGIVTPNKEIIIVSKVHTRIGPQEFWYVPKGKMEPIDNDVEEDAAVRESSEETGLKRALIAVRGRIGDFPELGLTNKGVPNPDDTRTLKLWSATTDYEGPLRSKEPEKHKQVLRMQMADYGDYFPFEEQRNMMKVVIKKLLAVHKEAFVKPGTVVQSARKRVRS